MVVVVVVIVVVEFVLVVVVVECALVFGLSLWDLVLEIEKMGGALIKLSIRQTKAPCNL